jgi:hypothetical protein
VKGTRKAIIDQSQKKADRPIYTALKHDFT